MMSDSIPPVHPNEDDLLDSSPLSKWPLVFGVISLILAGLGGLCQVVSGAFLMFFHDMTMQMADMDVTMPAALKLQGGVMAVLLLILTVILAAGGVQLIRRARSGVLLHKVWAWLRLSLVVLGLAMFYVYAPAQIEYGRAMQEAESRNLARMGATPKTPKTDEELLRSALIPAIIGAVIATVYPLIVLLWFTKGSVREEVETWP